MNILSFLFSDLFDLICPAGLANLMSLSYILSVVVAKVTLDWLYRLVISTGEKSLSWTIPEYLIQYHIVYLA